jgi:thymidylate kinase
MLVSVALAVAAAVAMVPFFWNPPLGTWIVVVCLSVEGFVLWSVLREIAFGERPRAARGRGGELPDADVLVVCIEGAHGVGKTTVCGELCALLGDRARFLDEGFMASEQTPGADAANALRRPSGEPVEQQSLVSEMLWATTWFKRLSAIGAAAGSGEQRTPIIVTDRSPFSAACFAKTDDPAVRPLVASVVEAMLAEVEGQWRVGVVTVCLSLDRDEHRRRVADRLRREPGREELGEADEGHLGAVWQWYRSQQWDHVITNCTKPTTTARRIAELLRVE